MTDQAKNDGPIDTRLRVLTWNIWWRFGPWENRRQAIAATLAALDADLIALQEVWSDETTNLAAELAAELGYHHVFASCLSRDGLGFGNALLSRWPIARSESSELHDSGEHRMALFAEVDGPRGRLAVFSTHLNHKYEHSHIRQRQVADIARFVDRMGREAFPPILCGDFNADPASEEIRMLTGMTSCPVEGLFFHDAWTGNGDGGPGYTWDNANPFAATEFDPNRRIDYILVGGSGDRGAGQVVECRVAGNQPVDGVWPSDHFAVLAELRY